MNRPKSEMDLTKHAIYYNNDQPKRPNANDTKSFQETIRKSYGFIINNYQQYQSVQQINNKASCMRSSSSQPGVYQLPNHEPTRCSFKNNGAVKGYAANTNQGLVRNYNEDRVAIILNIVKPQNRLNENWPKCSFFGVYDGHGGVACADYLRDNLHQYIIREPTFPGNPKEALRQGFLKVEAKFLDWANQNQNKSGSCAIVVMVVGENCYVANVGDSRAVMSGNNGNKVFTLSRDHKPSDEDEKKRILEAGGKIYQSQVNNSNQQCGPFRVQPGRLSVSRTFGDIEAKITSLGGNPKCVICEPEIRMFKMTDEHDFIVIAKGDGIYDKLTSKEVIAYSWEKLEGEVLKKNDIHQCSGIIVESVMNEGILRKTTDNITVVCVALQGLKNYLNGVKENQELTQVAANYQQKINSSASKQSKEQTKSHTPLIKCPKSQHQKLPLSLIQN